MVAEVDAAVTAVAKAAEAAAVQTAVINNNALIINAFGYSVNLGSLMIILAIIAIVWMFWRIQKSQRLDFADMLTKDGRKVSQTKVMQLVGGIAGTWVIIKTGMNGTLSSEIFGIYLMYVASIEGFSKFISAKYNYNEVAVKDAEKEAQQVESDQAIKIDPRQFDAAIGEIQEATAKSKVAVEAADDAAAATKKANNRLSKGK